MGSTGHDTTTPGPPSSNCTVQQWGNLWQICNFVTHVKNSKPFFSSFKFRIFLGLVVHNIYAQCYVECSLHTIQSVHNKFTHYTFFIHPVHTYMHKSYIIEIKKNILFWCKKKKKKKKKK